MLKLAQLPRMSSDGGDSKGWIRPQFFCSFLDPWLSSRNFFKFRQRAKTDAHLLRVTSDRSEFIYRGATRASSAKFGGSLFTYKKWSILFDGTFFKIYFADFRQASTASQQPNGGTAATVGDNGDARAHEPAAFAASAQTCLFTSLPCLDRGVTRAQPPPLGREQCASPPTCVVECVLVCPCRIA